MTESDSPYTVSKLNKKVRRMLETGIGSVWLEGEISNYSRPASGHMYFSLKDSNAQIRCAMFKGRNIRLKFKPESGLAVLAKGMVSLYEPRGEYQFIVEAMQQAGAGALQQAFEALKQKLRKEGLFDEDRKQLLPKYPQKLGLITSPTGAAIRDVLTVLKRRYPMLEVTVFSTAVQGNEAAEKIVTALQTADLSDCDILLLTRGGGSIEDLWSFNEEIVARAVGDCKTPIVCGVGHETDFSIAEFVADIRAATPSAAAEIITPDCVELKTQVYQYRGAFDDCINRDLEQKQQTLDWLGKRLQQQHPQQQMEQQKQRLLMLQKQLLSEMQSSLRQFKEKLANTHNRLLMQSPKEQLSQQSSYCRELKLRLQQAQTKKILAARARLDIVTKGLDAISPVATLQRGYSIITKADGTLVDDAAMLSTGDLITARLAKGQFNATVKTSRPESD